MYLKKKGSVLIGHQGCLSCDSSDGRALYRQEDGSVDSYCFVCNTYFPSDIEERDKKGNSKMNMEKDPRGLEYVQNLPMEAIPSRGITEEAAKMYGVRTEFNTLNREPLAFYFPVSKGGKITGYKKRYANDKKFTSIGDVKQCDLFGQLSTGDKGQMVVITEGELDALSAWQMFKSRGKNYKVWSLPHGANIRSIEDNLEALEVFDSVILAFDQDKPGNDCADKAASILQPGKVRIMSFSEKDANDMLKMGKEEEWFKALNSAKEVRPDGIINIEDIIEEASTPIERGLSWPWPSLSEVSYGIRRKELYGFGGGTGAGKTEGFKEVIQHLVHTHNLKVGLFFLEESPAMTAKVIAGKIDNKMYHVPEGDWTEEDLRKGIEGLTDKVVLYNHFGQKSWDNIKMKIRYMVVALGIKDIFLDHLTALVADEENVNKALEHIMADMAAMTQELNFTLYYVSHLSTPLGRPHEEGGRVTASQFRGSRTIAYWTHFLFGYERDQQAEDIDDRNRVTLRVLKDRYTGMATGTTIALKYNRDTGRFLEEVREF